MIQRVGAADSSNAEEYSKVTHAVDAIQNLTLVHGADLSPDGKTVAWTLAHIVDDLELLELRLTAIADAGFTVIGSGPRDHDPAFSPDGTRLAYLTDSDGGASLMVLDLTTRSAKNLTLSVGPGFSVAGTPRWSPDGRYIAYAANTSTRDQALPYRITRAVGWADGVDLVDDHLSDIYVVEVSSGHHTRLTADRWLNHHPVWLANSEALVFLSGQSPNPGETGTSVRRVDLAGSVTHLIGPTDIFSLCHVGGVTMVSSLGIPTRALGGLFTIDTDAGISELRGPDLTAPTKLTESLDLDVNGDVIGDLAIPFINPHPLLLADSRGAVVRVQVQDRLEIHRVAITGDQSSEVLLAGPACYYPLALASDHLLYAVGTITDPPEIHLLDLTTGSDQRISDTRSANRPLLTDVEVHEDWVQAPGGPPVQTKFLRPAGTSGPIPTVLLIHGGPKAGYGQVFFGDAQLLCEAGFGVLLVNPRGSRGYGAEFAGAITGDWGNLDYQDLMAAVDHHVAIGLADPDRLGVAGLSYGGYMSSWIIGHSNRFRAAVIENPVTNFWSMYGTSDVGTRFIPQVLGATPYDDFETYYRCSPISYAPNCTTPSLLIQSERDHRCPPEQSKQFYSVLRNVGCPAEMLMLPGVSHEGSISGPPPVRRAQNEALLDWMIRYVLT